MEIDQEKLSIISVPKSTKDKLKEDFLCQCFLHSVFLGWPNRSDWCLQASTVRVWYILFSLYLLGSTSYTAAIYIMVTVQPIGYDVNASILENVFGCCFILEIFAFLLAVWVGVDRLSKPFNPLELQYYGKASVICLAFEIIFLLIMVVSNSVLSDITQTKSYGEESLVTGEWLGSLSVVISLCFIIVDARCSAAMVKDLCSLADNHTLTSAQVIVVKIEIQRRVRESSFMNGIIVIIAVLHSVLFLLLLLSTIELFGNTPQVCLFTVMTAVSLFLKEAIYLLIALSEISHVNDLADKLHRTLRDFNWSQGEENDNGNGDEDMDGWKMIREPVNKKKEFKR